MPAPDDHEIMFGSDPDRVGAGPKRGKAITRGVGILFPLRVEPPKKSVVLPNRCRRGRHFDPVLGNDLVAFPISAAEEQIAKARHVARIYPKTAAPARAAAD